MKIKKMMKTNRKLKKVLQILKEGLINGIKMISPKICLNKSMKKLEEKKDLIITL